MSGSTPLIDQALDCPRPWAAPAPAPVRGGAQAYDRSYALTVTSSTAATSVLRSARYPVVSGVNWRITIGAKSTAGAWSMDDALRWYDANGNELGLSGNLGAADLPADGQWWTLFDDRSAPAGAATACVDWKLTATATNSVLQLDAVTLRQVLPVMEAIGQDEQAYITLILRELYPGDLITVWRVGQDGKRTLVRGPNGLIERQSLDSDLMVIEDYEAPLGVPVSYYIETYDADSQQLTGYRDSEPVQLDPGDGNFAWLKDPGAAHRNLRVRVRQAPDWTRPIQQSAYRVRGRRNAVVHSDVRGGLEGDLVIWTEDDEQRAALHWLLDPGHVLLWRTAPGYGIDDTTSASGKSPKPGSHRTPGTRGGPGRCR